MGGNHFADTKFRLNSAPALAVSPKTGTVAIAWSACTVAAADCKAGNGAEVMFTRRKLTDKAFSQPTVINDKPDGQQFFPALAADPNGVFHASWLDSRNSGGTTALDVYATYTKDEGQNFGQNARVTSKSFAVDKDYTVIADYTGNAIGQPSPSPDTKFNAHPVWNDGGVFSDNTGTGKLQTATLTLP